MTHETFFEMLARRQSGYRSSRLLAPLSVAMLLCACSRLDTPTSLIADAKTYQAKGDNKAAVIQLKNALKKAPDNAEARLELGELYNASGDSVSAESELRKALALGSDRRLVLPQLALALLDTGRNEQLLEETKNDAAGSASLLASRGNAQLALKQIADAHQSFSQAVASEPGSVEGSIGLAKCALFENDDATATRISDKLIATAPKKVDVWLLRGDLLRLRGRTTDALAAYNEAVKLQPDSTLIRLRKASLEIENQKFAEAKTDIDAAEKSTPSSLMVKYTRSLLEFNEKKFTPALDNIQQVLRMAPESLPSLLLAGSIHYSLGSLQQAEQSLKKYLDSKPDDLYARKLLSATLLRIGEPARALDVLRPALAKQIPDAPLFLLAGDCYMALKDYASATDNIEKAQRLTPDEASVHAALGVAKLARGDSNEGIAELEKAAVATNHTPQIGMLLITAHVKAKEWDKALAATKELEKNDPKNPVAQNIEGEIFLYKGDNLRARESFEKALLIQPGFVTATINLAQLDVIEKKSDSAIKRLESLLGTDPKSSKAMTALANIALANGKPNEARSWLEKAVVRNPDSVLALSTLGNFYLKQGLKNESLALIAKAQTSYPDNKEILYLLAQTQLQLGNPVAALENYNKLVTLMPASVFLQTQIASAELLLKNSDGAKAALTKALQIEPSNLNTQVMLGLLEARKGNTDAALGIARSLESIPAGAAAGFSLEGAVMQLKKNLPAAVKAFERAFVLNTNGAFVRQLHDALLQAGRKKEADLKMARWLEQHPNDDKTRMYLADRALKSGLAKDAVAQLEIVLKNEAGNVAALNNLAWAYQLEKDPRAHGVADRAYLIAPDDPLVLDTVGIVYLQAGEVARSVDLLKKAVTRAPEQPEIRLHLAQALTKSGDKIRAKTELEAIIKSNNDAASVDEARSLLRQM